MINIILLEPEIPQNTGNIARTCAITNSTLHLIEPLGFSLDEKHIKRSGMDYWNLITTYRYTNYQEFLEKNHYPIIYMATTKAQSTYTDITYPENCYIMFGKESRGIPEELLLKNRETCIRIPMIEDMRSLNLSNSVAIILYEALRQQGFKQLVKEGQLHHYKW